jgi:hypothetical protein
MAIFRFTDPDKAPIIVGDLTTNGPALPSANLPLHALAVSANTSLILVGKGVKEYGELIQDGILSLLENFANGTEPAYPVEGQLWYNNNDGVLNLRVSSAWQQVALNGNFTIPFDLDGQRITNLALPTQVSDAATKGFVDDNFLNLAGGVMSGAITLTLSPIANTDATNKQYVDSSIITAIGSSGAGSNAYTDAQVALKVSKAGDTITGPIVIDTTSLNLQTSALNIINSSLVASGSSVIDFGLVRVTNVGTPTNPSDAATKAFVDARADAGTVQDSTFDSSTGILTLQHIDGSVVELDNTPLAPYFHQHILSDVLLPLVAKNKSYIDDGYVLSNFQIPSFISLDTGWYVLDAAIQKLTQKNDRYLVAGNGTTTITLPFVYPVSLDKLSVYEDGIKLYRNSRGRAVINTATSISGVDNTPLSNSTYYYNATIDGVLYADQAVNLTNANTSVPKYYELIRALASSFTDSGYALVTLSSPITGSSPTGLIPGNTYGASLVIDGTSYTVSILGSTAQTYDDLNYQLSSQTGLALAPSTSGSTLRLTARSRGVESSVTSVVDAVGISPYPLFASLTNYVSVGSYTPGVTRAVVTFDNGYINVLSPGVGATSDVVFTDPSTGTSLLTALSATSSHTVGTSIYAYNETGIPLRYSNTVTFSTNTNVGKMYEFTVQSFGLRTDTLGNIV